MDPVISQFVLFADPAVRLAGPGSGLELRPLEQVDVPEGRSLTFGWPTGTVDEGTLSLTLHDSDRKNLFGETLWERGVRLIRLIF